MNVIAQSPYEALQTLIPTLRTFDLQRGPFLKLGNQEYVQFASLDFLGLGNDKRLCRAAMDAISRDGVYTAAFPDAAGRLTPHRRLERRLSDFRVTEDSVLFGSVYHAWFGALSALSGSSGGLFVESNSNESLQQAARAISTPPGSFSFEYLDELERSLKKVGEKRQKIVAMDSVSATQGTLAPLAELFEVCVRCNAHLMVDETLAVGVLGLIGSGALEHFRIISKELTAVTGFCYSLGGVGAAVSSNAKNIERVRLYATSYTQHTVLPPPTVYAVESAIELVEVAKKSRDDLCVLTDILRKGLLTMGFKPGGAREIPITVLTMSNATLGQDFVRGLFERGIVVCPVLASRINGGVSAVRISLSAKHTREHIAALLQACEDVGKRVGILPS